MPPCPMTVVLKSLTVDTCTAYDAAPTAVFHDNVRLVGAFIESFAGAASPGIAGAVTTVVKLQVADQALIPPAFVALTSQ